MKVEMQNEDVVSEQFRLSMKAVEETGFSILGKIEKRSEEVFDGVHSFMTGIEETDAYRLGNSYASCLRGVEVGVLQLLERRTVEGDVSAIEKTSRSAAAGVKTLVKRLEEDDVYFEGKTSPLLGIVEMIEDIQAKEDVVVKTSRSTATDVKKLVKRLGKDDGKTVELLEGIQAKLLGITKQMNVTGNRDIKRWDALMSHLNRDRWWQVWKWSVWNFRVSFTRRED